MTVLSDLVHAFATNSLLLNHEEGGYKVQSKMSCNVSLLSNCKQPVPT